MYRARGRGDLCVMDSRTTGSYTPLVGALATAIAPAAVTHFSIPPDGATFSAAALTIFAFLMGAMASTVMMLFRELLNSKDDQITELKLLARRGTEISEKALERTTP